MRIFLMATLAQLIDDYLAGPTAVRKAVAGMTSQQLRSRPIAGKWSTVKVVCHLTDFAPVMPNAVLGLDVGGDNLKAVHADGTGRTVPFALWQRSAELPAALAALIREMPRCEQLAVTMTGELCDCYESKRQGVAAILDAMQDNADGLPVRVWRTDGRFVSAAAAKDGYLLTASANWHELST